VPASLNRDECLPTEVSISNDQSDCAPAIAAHITFADDSTVFANQVHDTSMEFLAVTLRRLLGGN
jgi:hypothetical protein